MKKQANQSKKSFKPTPIPHRTKSGEPMAYYTLSDNIQTLRMAVNTVRSYYNLSPVTWNEEIVAGKTTVKNWPFHIAELRKAIEPVVTAINGFDSSSPFDIPPGTWLPIGIGRPKADVMQQIQNLILML